MSVVSVPCVRPVLCQADYHMVSLPRLAHDGREELYWARVSLMPCDGHMYLTCSNALEQFGYLTYVPLVIYIYIRSHTHITIKR